MAISLFPRPRRNQSKLLSVTPNNVGERVSSSAGSKILHVVGLFWNRTGTWYKKFSSNRNSKTRGRIKIKHLKISWSYEEVMKSMRRNESLLRCSCISI